MSTQNASLLVAAGAVTVLVCPMLAVMTERKGGHDSPAATPDRRRLCLRRPTGSDRPSTLERGREELGDSLAVERTRVDRSRLDDEARRLGHRLR